MFQNTSTIWIEIIALFLIGIFLITIFGLYVYKKVHHLPIGECSCCHMSSKQLVKKYHKAYANKK